MMTYDTYELMSFILGAGIPLVLLGFVLYCLFAITKSLKRISQQHEKLIEVIENKK
ncbi:MAG: hypothetical protein ACQEQ2_04995 [Pseudomonadota bacterium]